MTVKPVMRDADNAVEFVAVLHYPTVGSLVELAWEPSGAVVGAGR